MVFLAAVGPLVEFNLGRWKFLVLYLASGLFGVLVHFILMRTMGGVQPLVGASGAIAGAVGYCAVRYMSTKVPIAPGLGVPVGVLAAIWVLLQVLGTFVRLGDAGLGNSAFWAHLAGFLVGVVWGVASRAPDAASIELGHDVLNRMNDRGPAALLSAADQHLARHPDDKRALRDRANALHQMGERHEEAKTLARLLELAPEMDQPEVVQQLDRCGGLSVVPVIDRLRLAEGLKAFAPAAAIALFQSVVDDRQATTHHPDAMLSLALLLREKEPARVEQLVKRLTNEHALHPATEIARSKGLVP